MVALTTAFFTAALALIGNIVLSFWRLDQDRRGVAAALAGEIGAYIKLINAPVLAAYLRHIAAEDRATRQRVLRSSLLPSLGHPVFDKVADKIGLLPIDEAERVSAIYSFISTFNAHMSDLSSDALVDLDDEFQTFPLVSLAARLEQNFLAAGDLVERLALISRQGWRARLRAAWRGE